MSQLYFGKDEKGYYAIFIPQDNVKNQVYLTTVNGKGAYVSLPGLISSLCNSDDSFYSPNNQVVFRDNANPPITPEERTAISDLVKRRIDDLVKRNSLESSIASISAIASACVKKAI